jgi:hypothetical protein
MKALLAILCCLAQDEPAKILADPARRSVPEQRLAALEAFHGKSHESSTAWAATRFLERSDREWRLVYDRLKTPTGATPGTVEGTVLVTFSGQRIPVSTGTVEKDVRDPAAAGLDAYFAQSWLGGAWDEAKHRAALEALMQILEKTAGKSEAGDVLRHFALVHVGALGDKAAAQAQKLGLSKEGDRWGKREHLLVYALSRGFGRTAYVPSDIEAAGRSSTVFPVRYAATLLDIQKAFTANSGYLQAAKGLSTLSGTGAPKGAAEHVKALAESLKKAVYCGQCKDGKSTCGACQGKKRIERLKCPRCKSIGWMQKPGAPADTLVKCIQCKGEGWFRNLPCGGCKETGNATCLTCEGKPWRDGFKGCKECKACGTCRGKKEVETECATCKGKGRVRFSLAGVPTELCDTCKGDAVTKSKCTDCSESGMADCVACGAKGARTKPGFKLSDVWTAEACAPCGGSGWPVPNLAVPCGKCLGLGARLKPVADPSKLLE